MEPIITTCYKHLASLLSDKLHQSYNQTIFAEVIATSDISLEVSKAKL